MTAFERYHRDTGGCNIYCKGNRHAVPMLTIDRYRPIPEREVEVHKKWPNVRLIDVLDAELPNDHNRIGHHLDGPYVSMLQQGEYDVVLFVVEVVS